MSLTGHLGRADSPVRALFAERLALTRGVASVAGAQLRAGRTSPPLGASTGVNAGLAGTAVDYLLRFAIAPEPCPPHSSCHRGAGMLGGGLQTAPAAMDAVHEALEHVARVAPHRRDISDDQWLELTQISILLAVFEQTFRSAMPPGSLQSLPRIPSGWREWAQLVCAEDDVEDVAMLGWAAAEDHRDLRGRPLTCNPTFMQSRALGGADADLVTDDGLLLDFKSTSTRSVCTGKDLWQLCGYALADTHDEHAIRRVGLSVLRWRARVTWPLSDLLEQLAGEPVSLETLRGELAALLEQLATVRRRSAEERRRLRCSGG